MTAAQTQTELVPLWSLEVDQTLNPREDGTPEDVARDYAERMRAGDVFPPGRAFRDRRTGKVWLSRGFTRRRACEIAELPSMLCEVIDGNHEAAALDATHRSANGLHGQRMTTQDKRKAIRIILAIHSDWTNKRIADHIGVDDTTVADVREQLEAVSGIPKHTTRIGADGKQYQTTKPRASQGPDAATADPKGTAPRPRIPAVVPPPRGAIPEPDPRADFEADLDILCADIGRCRAEAERLGGLPDGGTIGWQAAVEAFAAALESLWGDRKGRPPGSP